MIARFRSISVGRDGPITTTMATAVALTVPAVAYYGLKKWQSTITTPPSAISSHNFAKKLETDNMTWTQLFPLEESLLKLSTPPITSLTWFQYQEDKFDFQKDVVKEIQDRVEHIAKANPWVVGKLEKRGKHYGISYDPFLESGYNMNDIVKVYDAQSDFSKLGPDLSWKEQNIMCGDHPTLLFKPGKDLVQPSVWMIGIIHVPEKKHFAVAISFSHAVGDGYTFYKMYGMLFDFLDNPIEALEAHRPQDVPPKIKEYMGEVNISMWGIGLPVGIIRGSLGRLTLGRWFPENWSTTRYCFDVDDEAMESAKREAIDSSESDGGTPVPFVSTNDVITSWFFRNMNCSQGTMSLNMRNRVPDCHSKLAGHLSESLVYRPEDASSPVLVRRSLDKMKRVVTTDVPWSQWNIAFSSTALLTNWASLHPSGKPRWSNDLIEEIQHFPLLEENAGTSPTFPVCNVYRSALDKVSVNVQCTPSEYKRFASAPFWK